MQAADFLFVEGQDEFLQIPVLFSLEPILNWHQQKNFRPLLPPFRSFLKNFFPDGLFNHYVIMKAF